MLEQRDFINVENYYSEALNFFKTQLKKGNITYESARHKAKVELLNLKHKLPLLSLMLPEKKYSKLEKLVKQYEDFIGISKSLESSL